MKNTIIAFVLLMSLQNLKANDVVGKMSISMISPTEAKFTHDSAYAQCTAQFVISCSFSPDTINIYETDTTIHQANCICPFDLSVIFTNLQANDYKVLVYRSMSSMLPAYFLIGELDLTVPSDTIVHTKNFDYTTSITNLCDSHTDLQENSMNIQSYSIWPIPATNLIHISNSEEIKSIAVYNTLGKKLMNLTINNGSSDLSDLDAGMYYFSIISKEGRNSVLKCIKK